jgi:hypothetical protein
MTVDPVLPTLLIMGSSTLPRYSGSFPGNRVEAQSSPVLNPRGPLFPLATTKASVYSNY